MRVADVVWNQSHSRFAEPAKTQTYLPCDFGTDTDHVAQAVKSYLMLDSS
jgi:hypothetical protein